MLEFFDEYAASKIIQELLPALILSLWMIWVLKFYEYYSVRQFNNEVHGFHAVA